MNKSDEIYWSELGAKWKAIADPGMPSHLSRYLKLQGNFMRAGIVVAFPLAVLAFALGAWTIWKGASTEAWFFVTRGSAICVCSALVAMSAWWVASTLRDQSISVTEMVDLSIRRADVLARVALTGIWVCAVLALFGTIGYGLRIHYATAPALPVVVPLAFLALLGVLFLILRRAAESAGAKYQYLRDAIASHRA